MSKSFKCGLVVGKFAPLHRGHEFLIQCALDACEDVVIISYCKPEFAGYESSKRQAWLSKLFPTARILVVTDEKLSELILRGGDYREIPTNDADASVHRRFCGSLCSEVLRVSVDAVFTSEDYGEDFARELSHSFRDRDRSARQVQHVLVDRDRLRVPVSGSMLREDIHANRHWLSPEVYGSFVRRVCLLGGESSGKSTLSEALAQEYATCHVREFGRDLWESKQGLLDFADMLEIGRRQTAMEDEAIRSANQFLFCDTSPLTTLFYSLHLFGRADAELVQLANRSYDAIVLCAPDFPFMQDGTRQPESFRTLQHEWYLAELHTRAIPFLLAQGTIAERLGAIKKALFPHHDSTARCG